VVSIEATTIAIRARCEGVLEENDLKVLLQKEVDKLPERQKLALNLRVFEEMSFKEVADVMGCPYDTAKANYRHALMKLRHQFESCQTLSLFKGYSRVKEEQIQLEGGSV
jgi:RNA polymerase sigma-70 factor (ECF subfamily)